MNRIKLSLSIVLWTCIFPLNAQVYVPLLNTANTKIEEALIEKNEYGSTFLKPYDYALYRNYSSPIDTLQTNKKISWWKRKLFYESYLTIDSPAYALIANPLFDFSYGKISDENLSYYSNIRGAMIGGNIEHKLFFESAVIECQSRWPLYIRDFIHTTNVVPGLGQARRFGTGGFDYALAQGNIAFPVNKHWKIFLGTGKLFAGDGYRSLLLSDVAFNYPYLHIRFHSHKCYFSKIFATTMSDTLPITPYGVRTKRLNAFGIISFMPVPSIELSFFEGYVFKYPDKIKSISLNPLFFNPLPAVNLIKNDSNFSALMGLNFRINLFKQLMIYTQIALSNIHYRPITNENMGMQLGMKWYNVFNVRHLFFQSEWNYAGSSAYSASDSLLNYSHYNQPLAHILGNQFNEKILHASYTLARFTIEAYSIWSQYGHKNIDLIKHSSRFIETIAYAAPFMGSGPFTSSHFTSIAVGYWINPSARQKIEIGYQYRKSNVQSLQLKSQFFYISFKVDWINKYFDF